MISAKDFIDSKNKSITLLGMSGVGKTHLAKLIGEEGDWFHFSGDYRIGAAHLKEEIISNIANKMKSDSWLKTLLDNNSISINSQVTFDNLEPISAFLGKIGNPEEGGLPFDEFVRRQRLFCEAEKKAMYEVPSFIAKSQAKGFSHFINDAGGSLCELDDPELRSSSPFSVFGTRPERLASGEVACCEGSFIEASTSFNRPLGSLRLSAHLNCEVAV